jgi:integrase/recombinase XerD
MTSLSPLLEAFFTDRLLKERQASPNTIASYRDAFRLLLRFAEECLGKAPSDLLLTDLEAPFVGKFLEHLESERENSARSRNVRLAAVHSFFRFLSIREPEHAALISRVLAIPQKRCDRNIVCFLCRPEIEAVLASPDRTTWIGRRDHTLLLVDIQTGLRVSELIALRWDQIFFGTAPHIRCRGKGRKERCTPLTKQAVKELRSWHAEQEASGSDFVFPSRRGGALSRDAIELLLTKYAVIACRRCPSLKSKTVSPHVLRHTTAVQLLQAGVDRSTIALWLGHESAETTQMYLDADLSMKEKALALTAPLRFGPSRYKPNDRLLAFLEGL